MDLELQKSPNEVVGEIYFKTPKFAFWEVIYDYNGKVSVFITDAEKNSFLKAITEGSYYAEIRGNVLSKNFLLIKYNDEIAKADSREYEKEWNNKVNSTKSLMEQYEKHFKQVREEQNKYETKA